MIFQVRKNMNSARRRFLKYLAASPLLAGADLLAQEQRLPDPIGLGAAHVSTS